MWAGDLVTLRERAERPVSIGILDRFEADPMTGVRRILDALEWFWETALHAHWDRIQALQVADIEHPLATTHVAAHLAVAPATASEHLRILTGSGLLRSFRRGGRSTTSAPHWARMSQCPLPQPALSGPYRARSRPLA
ncbi:MULTISPECIES: helix-turn-helix domain-containing protein [unclassified Microbacterium]|uniref:helix-turn-helix domain-containing protein n=1 Tax=unclassified Microbacterium TaxID=2609290 RepID=UPI00214C472D|nr:MULTISPECIES: helix-turn-helix domain-containing protein [unclassified Microbacterium]MCR2785041.1 helix-turn-helix domain-containing protein [Microbacterium sp. zg.B96]WIM16577.1 helix-turn-helix domain-containing protein [Microbacterium sp. zg-B96]